MITVRRSTAVQTVLRGMLAAGALALAVAALPAAAPAFAAVPEECTPSNTLVTGDDIQPALDAHEPVICLQGIFVLENQLTADADVALLGAPSAAIVGSPPVPDYASIPILAMAPDTTVTLQDLTLIAGWNAGVEAGGVDGDRVVAIRTAFERNVTFGSGAAIRASEVTLIDCTFTGNTASDNGGAVSAPTIVVEGSTFTDNASFGVGGALEGDTLTISDSVFDDNGDTQGYQTTRGGAVASALDLTVLRSTFSGSTASQDGGAVYAGGSTRVENSTFVSNSADGSGGAVVAHGEPVTVLFSTFLDNTAGEGPTVLDAASAEVLLRGSILASTSTDQAMLGATQVIDAGGNLVSTASAVETGLSSPSPSTRFGVTPAELFGGATLADNGGPTPTLAIPESSPAVGAVPAGEPSVATDQRGTPRPAVSDAGAFQLVPPSQLAATGSPYSLGGVVVVAAALLGGIALLLGSRRRVRPQPPTTSA
ncbi:choice-of-anchor Q domain-containing protein [Schumannella luteola]